MSGPFWGGVLLALVIAGWQYGIDAERIFERLMVFLSWRLARSLERVAGTRRLQPQLRIIVVLAIVAGLSAAWLRGVGPGNLPPAPVDPVLALIWLIGAGCAVGAAWQAKFHRLAALILLGGAGLVVCVTFVWFSAPDLAITQLTVEIVTTVLLLLGLRWLPKRFEAIPSCCASLPPEGGPAVDCAPPTAVSNSIAPSFAILPTRLPPASCPFAPRFATRASRSSTPRICLSTRSLSRPRAARRAS